MNNLTLERSVLRVIVANLLHLDACLVCKKLLRKCFCIATRYVPVLQLAGGPGSHAQVDIGELGHHGGIGGDGGVAFVAVGAGRTAAHQNTVAGKKSAYEVDDRLVSARGHEPI